MITNLLLRGVARGRRGLLVLTYHRVLPRPDPLLPGEVDAAAFRWQLAFLARHFQMLTLREAMDRLHNGRLRRLTAVVTFDDGYANNAEVALPIMRSLGVPGTFFVASGFLDGGRMWNDAVIESVRQAPGEVLDLSALDLGRHPLGEPAARAAVAASLLAALKYLPPDQRDERVAEISRLAAASLPGNVMMTRAQVRELHDAGMEIGGHTVNHPILREIDDAQAAEEIAGNAADIARITGVPPQSFAYPNGIPGRDFLPVHRQMVADGGYRYAVTTAWGRADTRTDPLLVPRIVLWSRTVPRLTYNLARVLGNPAMVTAGEWPATPQA